MDVAIKSYVISILTGSTFDGFIDCTNIKQKRVDLCSWKVFSIWQFDVEKNANLHKSFNITRMSLFLWPVIIWVLVSKTLRNFETFLKIVRNGGFHLNLFYFIFYFIYILSTNLALFEIWMVAQMFTPMTIYLMRDRCKIVQCNLDLVTHLVCQKTVTKLWGVNR